MSQVFVGGPGNHTFIGGSGTNTLDYSAAPSAINVNLANDTSDASLERALAALPTGDPAPAIFWGNSSTHSAR
jgi:hypothetical protein